MIFYTHRHRASAELIGCSDDMTAERPLCPIMGATSHQFGLDLDFDERKIPQLEERSPLAAEAIHRNRDFA